ncbi:hypothetical protein POPTR_005G014100v4 [Populus trichocarpa]|uniref:Uncharacterized protein n=1 Tax=Populus trichocarpa TaxID=3694 RepID=A0ACC0SX92_POPTR|nr:hypothetical protein BDE02_05G011300 [Populus trichocarpa]KAI9393877.1 hypothetical protein POPTR_005G014100v4 [Populus trichocarpa]
MARVPGKHGRDQALDWELLKDTDKKMKKKSRASDVKIGEDGRSKGKTSAADSSRSGSGQYEYSRNFGAINRLSSSFTTDEITVDATTEKELGNEYFKQKKFNEAIECYSRSIALSPTAVAYANRAMAYLKIKRFREAEDDCTEALNLDDRYIKAYSRRATARKELGKLKESIEDSEFALKLEPNNQEIKKQYAEVKSLYEKEILQKASGTLRSSLQGTQQGGRSEASVNGHAVHPVSIATQKTGVSASKKDNTKENDGNNLVKKSVHVKELRNRSKSDGHVGNDSPANATPSSSVESVQKNNRTRRQELKTSVIELASQAASRAMAEAAKNITPPNSAYQFEVSWQGFSGDRALQAHLLKVFV